MSEIDIHPRVGQLLHDAALTHYEICRAIWNNTYRHDTLVTWHEVKPGTTHHKRVLAAAHDVLLAVAPSPPPAREAAGHSEGGA